MDIFAVIGVFFGITMILIGQAMEGGNIGQLLQITAFFIVIGIRLFQILDITRQTHLHFAHIFFARNELSVVHKNLRMDFEHTRRDFDHTRNSTALMQVV